MREPGLRGRLFVLVLLALLPAFGLLVCGALAQRNAAREEGRAEALRLAKALAEQQQRAFREATVVLDLLARSPAIRSGSDEERTALLGEVLRGNPVYANLGISRLDGTHGASVLPVPRGMSTLDRSWFRKVLATGKPAVGEYQIGKITGRASINAAVPVPPDGEMREILYVALDLARLHEAASRLVLPEGAVFELLDAAGTLLVRHPAAEDRIGKRIPPGPLAAAMLSGNPGTLLAEDPDGVPRQYGFVPLRDGGTGPVAFLCVGLPEDRIAAAADRALLGGLLGLGIAAAAAVVAAWLLGGLLVVRPVSRLEKAIARVKEGDLSARSGPPYAAGEMGALGRAFDSLASTLEAERRGRKEAEAGLEESEALFRQMAETIEEVFWVSEPGEKPIRYVSPAFERIWGIPPPRLYEKPSLWQDSIHPSDRDRVAEAITRGEEAGTYDETYRIVRPDASVRWIHDRAFPVRDDSGEVVRIFGIAEDVTRSRELEDRFHQAQKMEAVGRLAAGVAHDFNNLLTVIAGYAELGHARAEGPVRGYLDEILKASMSATDLTRQLLAFSRKQAYSPEPVDLGRLLAGMERMVRRLVGEDVEVVTVPAREPATIHADPGHVRQIVLNLVVNSRDAMPRGGRLTLETYPVDVDEEYARHHLQSRPGPYVVLAVTDTGTGMDEETKRRLFEPFFTTKGPGKGTGLGLATVYGIVKQSGGDIWVYSEQGVGTTFKIYFPRSGKVEPPGRGNGEGAVPLAGPRTILVVEDDPSIRSLLYGALREEGHTVLVAGSAEEALREMEGFPGNVDLLLTDLALPGMNGHALAGKVRERAPGAKVLLVSGYGEAAATGTGDAPPGLAYLAKPFSPAGVARRVREVLSSASGSGA